MGLSASIRVSSILETSPEFDAACNSVYDDCLNLAQHAFSGVRHYQLSDASLRLHLALTSSLPFVKQWMPSPPSEAQVDRAIAAAAKDKDTLNSDEFKAFSLLLFRDVIVCNARNRVLRQIPVGIAGIAGLGAVTRSGRGMVGSVIGVYALGVTAAVYLSLSR
ncbi:hypothetical protein H6P81_016020 [Aristolochia fimbriata]|uniref:Uncharacterized protein n=1 Tax=Aristolochia fimbriata TaxID=158543 RepID=A0AAV7E729_ARIFI|nr:hypothetical protein H6P81_016020 [Aristolochia fimbriata]